MGISTGEEIAVVGVGCWYPGARGPRELWENILTKRRQFRRFPDQRLPARDYYDPDPGVPDKLYTDRGAFIDGLEFDWAARRIPKQSYLNTDIVQWLALEVAEQALKDAGYTRETVPKDRTGVVVGNSLTGEQSRACAMRLRWPFVRRAFLRTADAQGMSEEQQKVWADAMEGVFKSAFPDVTEDTLQGGLSNTIAGRICNYFDLHGGGYVVDGACASSLLAVYTGASNLISRDMDVVVAGGVDVSLDTFELIGFSKTGALTPDDMNVYDWRGNGFLPGEGSGFVVMKRLEDARAAGDTVYATLSGWGISSDGKGGITAPSRDGQAEALRRAYERSAYSITDLDFIEGHGTGTAVGDRVELEGIAKALELGGAISSARRCGVTSFKSIVGHTKAAAGIGAFIKAVIAVNRRVYPPTAGYKKPNAVLESTALSLYPIVNGKLLEPESTLHVGVSAMGFGGINSHVTVQSADPPSDKFSSELDEKVLLASSQDCELFVLSGSSASALKVHIEALVKDAAELSIAELTDLAASLALSNHQGNAVRAAFIASTPEELCRGLNVVNELLGQNTLTQDEVLTRPGVNVWVNMPTAPSRVGFVFPGQGSQQLASARFLVNRYQWAADLLDEADRIVKEIAGEQLSPRIFPDVDKLVSSEERASHMQIVAQTQVAQPAICLVSLLYATYLKELGIEPSVVMGHSLGELTAFHISGVFSHSELLRIAAIRGQAMAGASQLQGAMASLSCNSLEAERLLVGIGGYVVVANCNSPRQTVISGEQQAVADVCQRAEKQGVVIRHLPVSGAFHSRMMSHAAEVLRSTAAIPVSCGQLKCDVISSVRSANVSTSTNPADHLATQIVSQVDFITGVNKIRSLCDTLIEVGPGRVLTGLIQDILPEESDICAPIEGRTASFADLNTVLGRLFVEGHDVDWAKVYEERLVREYKPAAQRIFIDNPCERPLQDAPAGKQSSMLNTGSMGSKEFITRTLGVESNEVEMYLRQRKEFIADVVKADMASMGIVAQPQPDMAATTTALHAVDDAVTPKSLKSLPEDGLNEVEEIDVEADLLDLVATQTGYAADSLDLNVRLLDDLNLDSIKAGELIAVAARRAGVAGRIDPATLSNASIAEIAIAIKNNMVSSEDSTGQLDGEAVLSSSNPQDIDVDIDAKEGGQDSALSILFSLVEEKTGFPSSSFSPSDRLLDDLNLDSIKAGELIASAAKEAGVTGKIDPASLANSTLESIATALVVAGASDVQGDLKEAEQKKAVRIEPSAESHVESADQRNGRTTDSGIKSYSVVYENIELAEVSIDADRWSGHSWLIVAPDAESGLSAHLAHRLTGLGSTTQCIEFKQVSSTKIVQASSYDKVIAILPTQPSHSLSERGQLEAAVQRLRSVLDAIQHLPVKEITFIQYGGGRFGRSKSATFGLEKCACVGLASSLSLERPDLKINVIDFSPELSISTQVESVLADLQCGDGLSVTGYDVTGKRYVPRAKVSDRGRYSPRRNPLGADDVVLVTGGAKGITAECALALGRVTRARFVLVGSSRLESRRSEDRAPSEIEKTLLRWRHEGLECSYRECDVSDADAVDRLVQSVSREEGPITGFVHGAGINRPGSIFQVDSTQALAEIAPKVIGAINILRALSQRPPKLIVGITSIIGITGMSGNAWYAYSNEVLDLLLRDYARIHPHVDIQSVAYSVWDEVGMGHRLGVVEALERSGVGAIPVSEGTERFVELVLDDPGDKEIIVAGALGGLATWRRLSACTNVLPESRFLERVIRHTPGVDLAVRCHLDVGADRYLADHNFNGSYLFPTVFGLEAMAQVACSVAGLESERIGGFENITLERPIVVDPKNGVDIELRAKVVEDISGGLIQRVEVGVFTEQTGFATEHFSSTVVFDQRRRDQVVESLRANHALRVDPKTELYGDVLFQGEMFQRIDSVRYVDSDDLCVTAQEKLDEYNEQIAGDPFFRDAMLQSVQLPVVPDIVLPIGIGRIERFSYEGVADGSRRIYAKLTSRNDNDFCWNVYSTDGEGRILELMTDYRVRIVQRGSTEKKSLITGFDGTSEEFASGLSRMCEYVGAETPGFGFSAIPGLHTLSKSERHLLEKPVIASAVDQWMDGSDEPTRNLAVQILPTGKPCFSDAGHDSLDLSITHDDEFCICVVGRYPQGCDWEPVTARTGPEWIALLGEHRRELLGTLEAHGDSLNRAGTRIWCSIESVRKASQASDIAISLSKFDDGVVAFEASADGVTYTVSTNTMKLPGKNERIFALVTGLPEASALSAEFYSLDHGSRYVYDAVSGKEVYEYLFRPAFKETSNLSRTVYYSSYLAWAGKVRELFMADIGEQLVAEIGSGRWGLVTNWASVEVNGHIKAYEPVLARFRLGEVEGSVIPFACDFYRITTGDTWERVARVEQETTWVRIIGHGHVQPAQMPVFLSEHLSPDTRQCQSVHKTFIHPRVLENADLGEVLSFEPLRIGGLPPIHSASFRTTLEDANLVGNVYYANYFIWQGRVRDEYFYSMAPEYWAGTAENGELMCVSCRMDYLRDAMPFDEIEVFVSLQAVHESGAVLNFEFFRNIEGRKQKLAVGEQVVAWVRHEDGGASKISAWPDRIKDGLLKSTPGVVHEESA